MNDTKDESPLSGKTDPETVFSKILSGEMPGSFVYRDEKVSAFMDIQPVNPGHVLVIPNEPAKDLESLAPETGAHLFKIAQRIAKAIRHTDLKCDAINLILADGEAAGQEVFHVHLHVVPRYEGDGFGFEHGENNFQYQQREDLDENALKISNALSGI